VEDQKEHKLNNEVIYIARTTVNKGRIIMKKNGREQGTEHSVLLCIINKQCSNYIIKDIVLQQKLTNRPERKGNQSSLDFKVREN
jgi:hypothetical protein